jgi:hypothetical protein
MADKTLVDCDVTVPANIQFGNYANAFRILPDSGTECFLDFCVYSAENNVAKVVSRIRVHISFLNVVLERLTSTLTHLGQKDVAPQFIMTNGVLRNVENEIVLLGGTSIEQ